jgi:hypothetical protein
MFFYIRLENFNEGRRNHDHGGRIRESRRVYPGGGAVDAAESHQRIAGRGSPRHADGRGY